MKQIPILFSTDMVQAILAGRKTQTRRTRGLAAVNKKPNDYENVSVRSENHPLGSTYAFFKHKGITDEVITCPYGNPGDVFYVRETTSYLQSYLGIDGDGVIYKADCFTKDGRMFVKRPDESKTYELIPDGKWTPSIHMKKKDARIWLRIKDVRVEQLMDISEKDAIAEGIEKECSSIGIINSFFILWDKIHGINDPYNNPWVWVIEFERCEKPE